MHNFMYYSNSLLYNIFLSYWCLTMQKCAANKRLPSHCGEKKWDFFCLQTICHKQTQKASHGQEQQRSVCYWSGWAGHAWWFCTINRRICGRVHSRVCHGWWCRCWDCGGRWCWCWDCRRRRRWCWDGWWSGAVKKYIEELVPFS